MNARTVFIDCNDQLRPVFDAVSRPDDPQIAVNREPFTSEDLPRLLDGCDICIVDHSYMPTDIVARCADLRHIVFLGTGPQSYMDIEALRRRGVTVHAIKGYGDTAVAEHAVALMFACARDLARMDRDIRAGTWRPREGVQLRGKKLGIIGLGGIGAEVARIAIGIGMEVLAWNRTPRPDAAPSVAIEELLKAADVVSVHLALSEETRGFLDAARLATMKPGAILINTARGALIDEAALVDALNRGHIARAGLDVFALEPARADHPLARLDSVTLSAHAGFRTYEASATLLSRALDIVRRLAAARGV
ncbi:MAG TPA: NAD(P)-dependent oxidoreductase [Roseiarcus sp.]|jgi:D-3-phosphoglycerate dehydrogenase